LTTILSKCISANDLQAELIIEGEHYDYLAKLQLEVTYKKKRK
jgi:hypothetical protein